MFTTLIEPEELAVPLSRSDWSRGTGATVAVTSPAGSGDVPSGDLDFNRPWAVIDCRFDLARPDWGASAYAAGHVPGAIYAHLDRDLSGPVTPASGRHPLPTLEGLAETLGRWGIDDTVQVVAYDQGNGAFAARLWWLLRWAGHQQVAVLNGGFAAWQQAGLPVETTQATDTTPGLRQPRAFVPRPGKVLTVSTAELERAVAAGELASGTSVLVDARGADRFAGENETIDPVAGHIPGARNHPFLRNVDSRGRFVPAGELRERLQATLGDAATIQTIAMCGSGVTACHNLLALEIAGLPGARLYAGSWSEWIRDRDRPVARGAQ
jgi:thiosulfate/3-mercaptopyruvate sulfurtransferase